MGGGGGRLDIKWNDPAERIFFEVESLLHEVKMKI